MTHNTHLIVAPIVRRQKRLRADLRPAMHAWSVLLLLALLQCDPVLLPHHVCRHYQQRRAGHGHY